MSPARQFAFAVLMEVEQREGFASDLLHSSLGRGLALADRRLATEIVMGVLRWRAPIDYVLEAAAHRRVAQIEPAALTALRMGVYQLRYLSRIPATAAVHESVELAKSAAPRLAGFVNAVLRHIKLEPLAALLATEPNLRRRREIEFSHPAWLLERWSRNFGPEAAAMMAEYDNHPPPSAIRTGGGLPAPTGVVGPQGGECELAPGLLLASAQRVVKGDITKSEAYREGRIAIQDEASQLIAYLLEPGARDRILDTCAAPGGKAALLHSLAPAASLITVEPRPQRARRLRRLLPAAAHVVAADASLALPFNKLFDRILVDAPCSGTGTLARNPEIRWRLSEGDPARVAELQMAILTQAAAALRPGGRLVYSVCSLEPEEGPVVVGRLLTAQPELTLLGADRVLASLRAAGQLAPAAVGSPPLTAGPYLQILPGVHQTDGFFAAILERAR